MKENGFSKERKVLLKLLSLKSDEKEENTIRENFLSGFDWGKFIKDSVCQAVCFFAFKRAEKYRDVIPETEYKKWSAAAFNNLFNNINVSQAQYKLTELLKENDVAYIILKGLSSASYYDDPSLRSFGDVDFLVYPEKKEEIQKLLLDNGYIKGIDEVEHHLIFRNFSVVFEMHLEISGIPSGEAGDKIRRFMKDALKERALTAIKSDFTDCEFYAPDKIRQGAILLIHMQHHMTFEGLGLRHLLDWAYFVKKTASENFWEDELLPFFKDIGLYFYAKVITKTCALYLNGICPKWCEDVPESLCAEVINDVLELGNFGRSDEEKSKSGIIYIYLMNFKNKQVSIFSIFK